MMSLRNPSPDASTAAAPSAVLPDEEGSSEAAPLVVVSEEGPSKRYWLLLFQLVFTISQAWSQKSIHESPFCYCFKCRWLLNFTAVRIAPLPKDKLLGCCSGMELEEVPEEESPETTTQAPLMSNSREVEYEGLQGAGDAGPSSQYFQGPRGAAPEELNTISPRSDSATSLTRSSIATGDPSPAAATAPAAPPGICSRRAKHLAGAIIMCPSVQGCIVLSILLNQAAN